MCDCANHDRRERLRPTRRQVLAGGVAAVVAASARLNLACAPPPVVGPLSIHPRATWGADLPPRGPLEPEDVRFLLVHHAAVANSYGPSGVVPLLRNTYAYQTGPDKRWPDVCYNFFVDRFGGIWEGRAGSLDGPVRADATGGSQGYAQLVCLLGDFMVRRPSAEMVASLVALLALLADQHALSADLSATVSFVSRGSERWPTGSTVTARPISGHRDMSFTYCPGDVVYPMLADEIPARVAAVRTQPAPPPTALAAMPDAVTDRSTA